ncbi:hypothetical protein LCGC14_1565380, partial [marine sediment metagenome]
PKSVSIIKGAHAGMYMRKKSAPPSHTRFLDHMSTFATEHNAGIVSLVACPPNVIFPAMFNELSQKRINGRPYLTGGCMMINKDTFDKLGYFDERIPRKIDIEYTQRAIKNGINLGYHPYFWAIHSGFAQPTEPKHILQAKTELTWKILQEEDQPTSYSSIWEKALWKILPASQKNALVNLTTEKYRTLPPV